MTPGIVNLTRTLDATYLNKVANTPGVREWLGGEGELDLSPLVSNPENVALHDECGGFVTEKMGPGLYECHSMFLPEDRGFAVFEATQQALRYMFVETDCIEIVSRVGGDNRAARGLALKTGFAKAFSHNGGEYFSLSYWTWLRTDTEIEAVGSRNSETEDSTYNRALGAFILMCKAGNAAKATLLFNRWARIARVRLIPWRA